MKRIAFFALLAGTALHAQPPAFDLIIRHGTVLDGSGTTRFNADVGIRRGHVAAIGDLSEATARGQIDATGFFVTPGFINIHSHASADALPTAVNMLLQGVTTEIFNADGNGPLAVARQMETLAGAGLALNIGGYTGFNAVWQHVVGNTDRRPSGEEIQTMRSLIAAGLDQGAWGVSAGLDYKPGYFARTEEVINIVDVARPARTNFTNHDRITPESNFSSQVGVAETIAIGEKAGLVPVVTHLKAQGREQGAAAALLASMAQATKRGHYTAADAYPYLAGQSGLGSLIIPGWAQEGGRDAMLKRFADPAMRARIVKESEDAMTARFGGPQGVYLSRTQQELTAVMQEMNYEQPAAPPAGIQFVIVNGIVAIEDGVATGVRAGEPLHRTPNMPSRATTTRTRSLDLSGTASGHRMTLRITQRKPDRAAVGLVRIDGLPDVQLGFLQVSDRWAALSATSPRGAITAMIDRVDSRNPGVATIAIDVEGRPWLRGTMPANAVVIK